MRVSFKFNDSFQETIKKLNNAAIRKFSKAFFDPSIKSEIEGMVRAEIKQRIEETETWQSLLGNDETELQLDAHFGIPKGELHQRLKSILNVWTNEVFLKPHNISRGPKFFKFTYSLYAIRADWNQVLSHPAGTVINHSKSQYDGLPLPWLEWILISGDALTISDYHIEFDDFSNKGSRSGKALMRPKFSWRIPPKFGPFNDNNNFVTRVLDELIANSAFKDNLSKIFITKAKKRGKVISGDITDLSDNEVAGLI